MTLALIDRFRDRLPVSAATPVVSLGEGSTPLLAAPRLSALLGVELWLKWEASNPTGSYKDRGMTLAVSKAVEEGAEAVICASTGNTAASAAAYAARATLGALVSTPLRWSELTDDLDPEEFTIETVPARLASVGDLWAAGMRARNSLRALAGGAPAKRGRDSA